MTNDNKPPMFGPSAVFDQAAHEPRLGKSALMNEMVAELADKPPALAEAREAIRKATNHGMNRW